MFNTDSGQRSGVKEKDNFIHVLQLRCFRSPFFRVDMSMSVVFVVGEKIDFTMNALKTMSTTI